MFWSEQAIVVVKTEERALVVSCESTALFCSVDIYVSCVSSAHSVTSKGFHLVIVSTTVETDDPEAELTPGLDLLAPIKEKYES